jgi:hypothetical protein
MPRRLVITVCPRERGTVRLRRSPGAPAARLDARAIMEALRGLIAARGLEDRVEVREGCAGGCSGRGPNVSVEIHAAAPPGHRQDHVAVDWKTYVYSIGDLDCLETVVDENLRVARRRSGR